MFGNMSRIFAFDLCMGLFIDEQVLNKLAANKYSMAFLVQRMIHFSFV